VPVNDGNCGYEQYPLDADYRTLAASSKQIRLVLLGKDPYPTGPTGIPFVKDNWATLNKNSAGYNVFCSLCGKETLSQSPSPRALALELAARGIVFLNCSYHYLRKEVLNKYKHFRYVKLAYEGNRIFLERADRVILCGQAYPMLAWVKHDLNMDKYKSAPHPSRQARNRINDQSQWDEYWQEKALSSFMQ